MCIIILTYKKCTCGILIDSVDDTRTQDTIDSRQIILTMKHNSIYQCSGSMSGAGMNHHSLWLIYDKYIIIFIKNIQRDIFRKYVRFFHVRNHYRDLISFLDLVVGFYSRTINHYFLLFKQLLNIRT